MPEHPPCLTPILKHKSSSRSALILFKSFNALSVNVIAGASTSAVDAAGTAVAWMERGFPRLRLDREDRKETEVWDKEKDCFGLFEKRRRDGQFVEIEEIAIAVEKRTQMIKRNFFSVFFVGFFLVEVTSFVTQLGADFF